MNIGDEELWNAIQERYAVLEPGTELVTPLTNRPFRVREISTDRLHIRSDDEAMAYLESSS